MAIKRIFRIGAPGLNASRYRGEIWLRSRNFATSIEFEPQGSTGLLEWPVTRSKIQQVAGGAGAEHVDPGLVAQAYGFRKAEICVIEDT